MKTLGVFTEWRVISMAELQRVVGGVEVEKNCFIKTPENLLQSLNLVLKAVGNHSGGRVMRSDWHYIKDYSDGHRNELKSRKTI